jgi:hypothetical protein
MEWELDRHRWEEFGKEAVHLPAWIAEFVRATDPERVDTLLSLIESVVVPVDGPLGPGAAAATACLVQGLLSATPASRVRILYLLFWLAGRVVDGRESGLTRDVRREVELGPPIYSEIAGVGSRPERLHCVDLLSICARFNDLCLARALPIMRRIATLGGQEASTVAVELDDLASEGRAIQPL